ncbi:roquin-2 isoform X1 [Vidua macroura]|nr:roquin-2 isoform X1 [Vidua macroura]XP_053852100.1 roquin-2 isoform X1 [Vidua macroura]XP_053852101.1 roquin-2 isoform X1 [Vidua macroura]XP_053852102.1 roquin-2 isoform X1 [Vidua macroura]
MPVQAAQWTEFLSCPICYNEFDENVHKPISLGCSHTVCKTCLNKLHRKACPFDQTAINTDIDVLPVNFALLQLVGAQVPDHQTVKLSNVGENKHYEVAKKCVEDLALYLKPLSGGKGVASLNQSALSRPMQRKLVTLVNCQLVEEEGRVRAMRAARSLGERTVTELILQHQNPQQLSANLWAAVRARGCQFLGPAMQEEALKLVLLALEDGSALSRKVLVLFVVQRLEPRFPQASKTSIGHVVQLLYRASCFKVTKRDEDSSLMQLKEEFRSYEALRREHDAQIVHIAMEAGLRISPEQWSSLLYGDLAHKSHMQSIIDKLQSPESFAKSVQELTIVLQRTGDPANLNRLRPHLELLANIDPNPDAASPTWEQLENAMVAVKTVVHGLVDFIQNYSRKGHETPQPQPNSKYKTSMCRDLRQQGGCPRGTNCTFAHSQEELEKYRLRNKKISATVRTFPLLNKVGVNSTVSTTTGNVISVIGSPEATGKMVPSTNGIANLETGVPQLIPRCADTSLRALDNTKKGGKTGANGQNASGSPTESLPENKIGSPPKTPVSQAAATSAGPPNIGTEVNSVPPKSSPFVPRVPVYTPHSDNVQYFQDPRTQLSYEVPQYPQTGYYPAPPTVPAGVAPCVPRFVRSNNVPESSLPPASVPYADHYSTFPPRDRLNSPYQPPPPQPYGPVPPVPSGMYAPVYDSRRIWRPQMYPRDDIIRSNSLPPMDVMHSSVYQTSLRERYNSLDGYYSVACQPPNEQRTVPLPREPCGHLKTGYDEQLRRKPEQWAQYHTQKTPLVSSTLPMATPSPTPPSPLFSVDFSTEFSESVSDLSGTKFEEDHLSHYSPWSCGTIGSCINAIDSEPKDVIANSNAVLMDLDSGDVKRRVHLFETQRRAKEEDPIIPFSDGPIISKWGAISRSSRTGYHTTDPIQATASQGSATKPISVSDYVPYVNAVDSRWSAYGSDSASSARYAERDRFIVTDLSGHRKHSSTGDLLSIELQQAKSNSLLLQREANALAMQQKWNSLDEGSRLTLNVLSKEIDLRNGETDYPEDCADTKPDRDIELELSALDTDEPDGQGEQIEEILDIQLGISSQEDQLLNGTTVENGHLLKQHQKESMEQKRQSLGLGRGLSLKDWKGTQSTMTTADDKLLGEKLQYYYSSSEGEDEDSEKEDKEGESSIPESVGEVELSSDGSAVNTGPKGVINDWRRFKQLETEQRQEQRREMERLIKKLSMTCRSHLDDEADQQKQKELQEKINGKMTLQEYNMIHNDEDDEEFLQRYRKQRMEEMRQQLYSGQQFKQVFEITSGEAFLDTVDKEQKSTLIMIHIYEDDIPGTESLNGCMICLAAEYPTVKFCRVKSSLIGASTRFTNNALPALLVYKAGELIGNFVRITDQLGEDFFAVDLEAFLQECGLLPEKDLLLLTSIHNPSACYSEDSDLEID